MGLVSNTDEGYEEGDRTDSQGPPVLTLCVCVWINKQGCEAEVTLNIFSLISSNTEVFIL